MVLWFYTMALWYYIMVLWYYSMALQTISAGAFSGWPSAWRPPALAIAMEKKMK